MGRKEKEKENRIREGETRKEWKVVERTDGRWRNREKKENRRRKNKRRKDVRDEGSDVKKDREKE
ncbi:hypothetical protein [Pseudoscardovia suis]|uniref:hypothetical protein n=1 Tax=Pseudoscardovia suis TaxID=987063 RepID=UPI003F9B9459